MQLIDTHTHIYLPELANDIEGIVMRANANGIDRFYLPNIDVASIPAVFNLVKKYPNQCYPMMGLHPCSVKENVEEELATILETAKKESIKAIGEIGIDLYWDKTFLKEQQMAFRKQIHLAKEMNLPIVIHCRDAFNEVYEILLEEKSENLKGIFHCFSGNLEQAKQIIALGLYLGIGGVLTYKNSGLAEVIKEVNLANLVLETDSPYLSPVPFRGKPNESSYLIHIANKLAEVKHTSLEEVARITTYNAINIFEKA